jgi:hypothetical protein
MSVPEAAVDKNGNAAFWEDEIRFAEKTASSSPSCYFADAENINKSQFGISIACRSNAGHHRRSLARIPDISHVISPRS